MSRHSHVVVGYDGSREGDHLVRWAVAEARLRRVAVTICHAWHWEYPAMWADAENLETVKRMAGHVLDHGVFHARATASTVPIRKSLVPGPAASALLHEAADAELIVIGAPRRGEPSVGSTAYRVAAMATCPVVMLRDTGGGDGRIVVGVDGAAGGEAALAFAFEEASLRDWRLHAVYGCGERDVWRDFDTEPVRRDAGTMLERAVAPWLDKYPRVEAWTHVMPEPPDEALRETAIGAEMLVVGDRGTGGPTMPALGAVSGSMVRHAPCTIAVAHPWRPPGEPGGRDRLGRVRRRPVREPVVEGAEPVRRSRGRTVRWRLR